MALLCWQKKLNARMKDALDETLILSDKLRGIATTGTVYL